MLQPRRHRCALVGGAARSGASWSCCSRSSCSTWPSPSCRSIGRAVTTVRPRRRPSSCWARRSTTASRPRSCRADSTTPTTCGEQGLAPVIVTTGGRQPGDRFTEATAGYNYLRQRGVPDEALLKEVSGTSTWEELSASARFLRDRGITDVLLVSDRYHAYRLEAIAEELGLDASCLPRIRACRRARSCERWRRRPARWRSAA